MRKIILLITVILFCINITAYSQRKETKIFVSDKRATLDKMPVLKTSYEDYSLLKACVEEYARTLNKKWGSLPIEFIWDDIPKKDRILLISLRSSIRDSINKRNQYDREMEKLEKIRLYQQNDSIRLAREKAKRLYQDSINEAQERKKHRDRAIRDSIRAKDPDLNAASGKGNSTFSDAPNTLARIFTKNATIESIVSTFPSYSANSADGYGTNRRTRIYNMSIGREARNITLEYDAKTRKVETIILYTHSPDKYKQILLNAGYRWDSDTSMTATAFGHGYRSYWKKKGSPIYFVFNDRIIKVFRVSR